MPARDRRRAYTTLLTGRAKWTPLVLSPQVWLEADALVNAGLVDGNSVATWTDTKGKAGASPNQAVAAQQPTLRTAANGINGHPAVSFDGTDVMALTLTAAQAGASAHTLFMVVQAPTIPTSDQVVFGGGINWWEGAGNTGVTRHSHVRSTDSTQVTQTGSLISFDSTPSLLSFRMLSGTGLVRDNGVTTVSTAYPDAITAATATTWFLGGLDATPTLPFVGLLGELILFNTGLSNGNRDNVEGYLRAKYGIV